jgi:hypothetical protein
MANQPHTFKDRDIKRVIKAVRATGEHVARVELDPYTGKIAVITGKPGDHTNAAADEVCEDLRKLI